MPISSGTRLGPYEVLGPLGTGGMGEVYRAMDPRLDRQVAVKVLPASFLEGKERRARFEREARILASLNHAGIAAIYSFEEIPGSSLSPPVSTSVHLLVMELLEGETLRARLAGGALPVRKAVDYAAQIAHGLAAAHEKGILHRDLKPENLFLTKDGRIKILDFGLAKLAPGGGPEAARTSLPTESAGTEPGVVVGTVGYMSPEQVRGEPLDARSDLFSFGVIVYEMLSGRRPFHRTSAAETMAAILREEPPDLSATDRNVPPGLERIIRRCLEKNPEERFHSASDLAFDLAALSGLSGPGEAAPPGARAANRAGRRLAGVALAAALAGAAVTFLVLHRARPPRPPAFRQLTFRRGVIWSARFGSDGKTVLYSAEWEGGPIEIQAGRTDGPDSRPFGLTGADVLAVAPSGDVAVALRSTLSPGTIFSRIGTLARTAATGGAPREILEGVEFADFSPDGRDLAVVRFVSGRRRLEFPPGKVLYETTGWIGNPRVSPRGDRIAFLDHPVVGDDGGAVALVDLAGKKTVLAPGFQSANGLSWSPDGSEIWFTASERGGNRALRAVTPAGRQRVLFAGTGTLTLQDVSRDGRTLLTHDLSRLGFVVRGPDAAAERDLSWFDASYLAALSADGRTALFGESGEAGGPGYSVFLRGTDGSPAVRLGEGTATSLSPDGKRVLAILRPTGDAQLVIYPTGPGESRPVPHPGLRALDAGWLPDGRRILLTASEPGHLSRIYLADSEGGAPKPLTAEGSRAPQGVALVNGRRFLSLGPGGKVSLVSLDGGEPVAVAGIGPDDSVPGPSGREGWILVRRGRGLPAHVVRLDPSSGREEHLGDLMPADPTGILDISHVHASRDGRSYGYDYSRVLSDLFVVEGLR